jgi:hypothetical protein
MIIPIRVSVEAGAKISASRIYFLAQIGPIPVSTETASHRGFPQMQQWVASIPVMGAVS